MTSKHKSPKGPKRAIKKTTKRRMSQSKGGQMGGLGVTYTLRPILK